MARVIEREAFAYGSAPEVLKGTAFRAESGADTFRVTGLPFVPTTIMAYALRADEETVAMDGALDGEDAVVTLHADCYNVAGRLMVSVYISSESEGIQCVYSCIGTVYRTTSDSILDSGTHVPSLQEMTTIYNSCVAAWEDCVAATEAAEELTTNAVQYTAQTKDASAQAVARGNIGAAALESVQIALTSKGYIQSSVADTYLAVDANGDPTITTPGSQTYRYIILSCVPGDKYFIKCSTVASKVRAVLCLGSAEVNASSSTGYSRPILRMINSTGGASVPLTVPEGGEMLILQATVTLINNGSNVYYKGIPYDYRLSALEAQQTIEETVSGTTPSITAEANHRYVCGTLDSLSFTPSAEGLCEVIFTSGTTATVLTLPSTVRMPDWWSGVEANRTYDIMVLDGTLAGVMSWAT